MIRNRFLHVGCGPRRKGDLKGFESDDWVEIRLDIDRSVEPDVLGTMTDLSLVEDDSMDAVYSSHSIEHLYPHEVPVALLEFNRVLTEFGMVVITCPDLHSICEAVVAGRLTEPIYVSPAGPITPMDVLFGYQAALASGNHYMAHRCGFTYATLQQAFFDAGFRRTVGGARHGQFDLWMIAFKSEVQEAQMQEAAGRFLP